MTGPRTIPPRGQAAAAPARQAPSRGKPRAEPAPPPSRGREKAGRRQAAGPQQPAGRRAPDGEQEPGGTPARGRPRRGGGGKSRLLIWVAAGGVAVVIALAAGVMTMLGPTGPRHQLLTPASLAQFVRRPQLEQQMDAKALQRQVIAGSAGQASHVVSAVYENSTGVTGKSAPQIFLFIGGNLTGTSPGDFITSFRGQFKGALVTSAGPLGGQAVCVNAQASMPGTIALCAWADNDTFGVLASPTMHAAQLGAEMRVIRPGMEHVVK